MAYASAQQPAPDLGRALAEAAARAVAKGGLDLDSLASLGWAQALADDGRNGVRLAEAVAAAAQRFGARAAAPNARAASADGLARLWQWQLWVTAELGQPPLALPDALLSRGRDALIELERAPLAEVPPAEGAPFAARAAAEPAGTQRRRLARCMFALTSLDVTHAPEQLLEAGYHIDLALPATAGAPRVALLLGTPEQYEPMARPDETHAPTPHTRLRWRQLGAMGWRVMALPFFEWDRLDGTEARRDYIARKLDQLRPAERY